MPERSCRRWSFVPNLLANSSQVARWRPGGRFPESSKSGIMTTQLYCCVAIMSRLFCLATEKL